MEIIDLIPQREPIVMVDKFVGITNGISETQLTIKMTIYLWKMIVLLILVLLNT